MEARWTLSELVAEVATRIDALPAPRNGQVRAIPDERTVRYYGTLGLLDRPDAMRGRTALYGLRHVAQVVAIKRLQALGRPLSEIQALWPTLDDHTLARMSGVALTARDRPAARAEFWKHAPAPGAASEAGAAEPADATGAPESARAAAHDDPSSEPAELASAGAPASPGSVELRIALAPKVVLSLSLSDERIAVSPADVRAIRAAAAPVLAELAARRLTSHSSGEET